jgi:hypothetical protein
MALFWCFTKNMAKNGVFDLRNNEKGEKWPLENENLA